ncbi:PDZ domain-containing protein [Filobacillus milosensis]|uniref:PDZ domain-containing protein n=1 Tax=Filobacillus milosensis TaxID=94137 RepID=A0A4Y8IU51_9BACI|nr:S41 family peptidase [Filobacillus milosensis]TFB24360.1 PDZ domain-containing protein [Filobacillus milosensis]
MNLSKKLLVMIVVLSLLVGGVVTAVTLEIINQDETVESDSKQTNNDDESSNEEEQHQNKESDKDNNEEVSSDMEIISYAMSLLEENYVDEISHEELIEGAIEGVVNKLDDPYSEYMDPETMKQFQSQIESTFEGIGAEVTKREGYITIVTPLKGTPAEKAGIRPNDRIIEVDGESLEGYTVFEAVTLIRGEKGTDVTLTIDRPGEEQPFEVVITRDTIPLTTVYSDVQTQDGKNVGVLQIRSFSEKTAEEFRTELEKLETEENIEGLVIDVRGNPGGLLNSVEDVLGHFLGDEQPYVQTTRRDQDPEPLYLKKTGSKDYPISVLVNEGSASASEILAAAMKEVGEYEVVGTTTFGKGTVQQTMRLGEGLLKVTVMKWLSPEGNPINEVGVEPSVEVKQPEYYYLTLIQAEEPLKRDANGEEVAKLQTMLEGIGYQPGRTDGYFDGQTETALENFQQSNDLEVTGVLNEKTEEALEQQILDAVNNPENDRQLQKAIDVLFE